MAMLFTVLAIILMVNFAQAADAPAPAPAAPAHGHEEHSLAKTVVESVVAGPLEKSSKMLTGLIGGLFG